MGRQTNDHKELNYWAPVCYKNRFSVPISSMEDQCANLTAMITAEELDSVMTETLLQLVSITSMKHYFNFNGFTLLCLRDTNEIPNKRDSDSFHHYIGYLEIFGSLEEL